MSNLTSISLPHTQLIKMNKQGAKAMTIWVNEQLDPSGLMYACIASCNQEAAEDCHQSFEENLTPTQKAQGWIARLRTVRSWDEVPVNALTLN